MAFTLGNRTLKKVGVVGSGQIGPDIALFFTKVLAPAGVPVVVVDVSADALKAGRAKTEKKIGKGVEGGAFKPEQAKAMLDNLTFTTDYDALSGADFVIEAATEDQRIKRKIVAQLESVCAPDAVLASNSSHMEPEIIFAEAKHPKRGLVIHYFFPAERNIVVEVVPSNTTDPAIARWLLDFYEAVGKAPILVKSRYGYAIDPIFEGIFQAAALCVEEGMGNTKQVDAIARKALKQGIGPFTAMNLTGGNPITAVGLDQYHDKHHVWFGTPKLLKDQLAKNAPWEVPGRDEKIVYDDATFRKVADAMTGAYFGLVGQILDSGISNVGDLEMACESALAVRPPFAWMNSMGVKEALNLVEAYAGAHPGFPVPDCLRRQTNSGKPWAIPVVLRDDVRGVAVLKIRRPDVLNALSMDVFNQLREHVEAVNRDNAVKGAVITGFGKKAFVSGGDITMLAALTSPAAGRENSAACQAVLNVIEDSKKPVVCAMNGLALGGGNELAMACHARIAVAGQKMLAGQPEVNLGIIPGAGGTQRLARIVGIAKAAEFMRTGRPISSDEAKSIGLVRDIVNGDVVEAAVALVLDVASGKAKLQPIARERLSDVPAKLPDVELGHLSRKTDEIVCRAILEGANRSLRDGLKLESELFGECCATQDMKIGMENFLKNGPRAKAAFVHA